MKLTNQTLTIILFACLAALFASTFSLQTTSLSVFQWDTPITTIAGTEVTRGDLFDMIKLLSGAAFLVGFVMVLKNRRKKD